jgi:hypothetical protein
MPENADKLSEFDRSALQAGDRELLDVGHEPRITWLERASTKLWPHSGFPHITHQSCFDRLRHISIVPCQKMLMI